MSKSRRMVIDYLHFARALPTVPVQKRMSIEAAVVARRACRQRPQWAAIFAKAYALVADEFPVLRRAYVKIPWPHLYEYPKSSANIVFERDYEGEPTLFHLLVNDVANVPLGRLRELINHGATAPIESVKEFRRWLRMAVQPRLLRRLFWWFFLNSGRQRGIYFGTFGVSVYSALDVDSLHPLSPLTTLLNYGYIKDDGTVDVRIIYDHRVMDGATVARALRRLEEILNGPIVEELRSMG